MPDESGAHLRAEMISSSLWLRSFLYDYVGEDVAFDTLIGRGPGDHPPHAENIFELDRLRLLRAMMENLQTLLGSERAAVRWLFHDERFLQAVGSVPFDYLEDGEFDALALLHALTEAEADHRRSDPSQIGAVPPLVDIFAPPQSARHSE